MLLLADLTTKESRDHQLTGASLIIVLIMMPTVNYGEINVVRGDQYNIRNYNYRRAVDILHASDAVAYEAIHKSQDRLHEPPLLAGTRMDFLNDVSNWMEDVDVDVSPIYLLEGRAGTGKSCIAKAIEDRYADEGRLLASFFFDESKPPRDSTDKLFPTIAYQFVKYPVKFPSLLPVLQQNLTADPYFHKTESVIQCDKLIWEPLVCLKDYRPGPTLLIVIDGIDTCKDDEDLILVVQQMAFLVHQIDSSRVRLFITSRPKHHIEDCLSEKPRFKSLDDKDAKEAAVEDIHTFLKHDIAAILSECVTECELDEDADQLLEKLVGDADGLFIYAATVSRALNDTKIQLWKRLDKVRCNPSDERLDSLYRRIMSKSGYEEGNSTQIVLATIVLLFEPLPLAQIELLLGLRPKDATYALAELHSVLIIPDERDKPTADECKEPTVTEVYHSSFRDFIKCKKRSKEYCVDIAARHADLAQRCLEFLEREKDRCKEHGGKPQKPTGALLYACRYWVSHVEHASIGENLLKSLKVFARKTFYYWVELLLLCDEMETATHSLERMVEWLQLKKLEVPKDVLDLYLQASSCLFKLLLSPHRQDKLKKSS